MPEKTDSTKRIHADRSGEPSRMREGLRGLIPFTGSDEASSFTRGQGRTEGFKERGRSGPPAECSLTT